MPTRSALHFCGQPLVGWPACGCDLHAEQSPDTRIGELQALIPNKETNHE